MTGDLPKALRVNGRKCGAGNSAFSIMISVGEIAVVMKQAIYQGVYKDRMAFITAENVDLIK